MENDRVSLESRVRRLEVQNRFLALAVAGLMLFGLVAATGRTDQAKAGAFQLTDAEGGVRAELAFRDGSPGLFIKDESGNDRLLAIHDAGGTGLYIKDDQDTTRIGVAQFAHGGGGVALHGPGSKGAAVLYLKGQGSLRFYDAEGKVTNQVSAAPSQGR